MIIRVGNVAASVASATPRELEWLWSFLSFRKGRQAARLHNRHAQLFLAGLVPMVQEEGARARQRVDVMDCRVPSCLPDPNADLSWLRPYQLEGVRVGLERTRGIEHCPTGSGKTELAIGWAKLLPCRWLFFVHRGNLMRQTAERYLVRTGTPSGMVGDDVWDACGRQFVVVMYQTIAPALKRGDPRAVALLQSAGGICADECHTAAADEYAAVLLQTTNAYYRFGLSGTPLARSDRRALLAIGALGPVIYRIRAPKLIEAGALADPTIRMRQHMLPAEPVGGTWPEVYEEAIIRSGSRNRAIVTTAKGAPKPALVFTKSLEHQRILAVGLKEAGLRVGVVNGSHATEERIATADRAVRGDLDVVVSSKVLQDGMDAPAFCSLLVGSAEKSGIDSIQRIGRVLRIAAGKNTCQVWDFFDGGCGCGGVHKACRWLVDHSRKRVAAYLAEGYRTLME